MDPASIEATPGDPEPVPERKRRRRWWLWVLVAIAPVVVLPIAAVLAFPSQIVRPILARVLEDKGIRAEGIETIRISIFGRSLRLGPIALGTGEGEPARVQGLAIELGWPQVRDRHVPVRLAYLDGLSAELNKTADGKLILNGIDLAALGGGGEEPPPPEDEEKGEPWTVSVDSVLVRACRARYTDGDRVADLQIDGAEFRDVGSAANGVPIPFNLQGRFNDIVFVFGGSVVRDQQDIRGHLGGTITGVAVERAERMIGPLGFDRRTGTVDGIVNIVGGRSADGRIEGQWDTKLDVGQLDISRPDVVEVGLASGELRLVGTGTIEADGAIRGSTSLVVRLEGTDASVPGNTRIRFARSELDGGDIVIEKAPSGGPLKITAQPILEIKEPALAGPAEATAAELRLLLPSLTLTSGVDGLAVDAQGTLQAATIELAKPISASTERAAIEIAALAFKSAAPGMSVQVDGGLDGGPLALRLPGASGEGPTIEAGAIKATLTGVNLGQGGDGNLGQGGDGTSLSGGLALGSDRLSVELPGKAGATRIEASQLALELPTTELRQAAGTLAAKATGALDVAQFGASLPKSAGGPPMALGLEKVRAQVTDLAFEDASGKRRIGGKADVDLTGLAAKPEGAAAGPELSLQALKLAVPAVDLSRTGAAFTGTANARIDLSELAARLPQAGTMPAVNARLKSLNAAVDRIDLADQPKPNAWDVGLDLGLDGIEARLGDGSIAKGAIRRISLANANLNHDLRFSVDQLVITEPRIDFSDKALKLGGGDEKPAAADQRAGTKPAFRIDRFAIVDGGQIIFRDGTVQPPIRVVTDLDTVEVTGLDSIDTGNKTDVRLVARVNEFTEVQLFGWALPFTETRDFDISARLGRLALPTLSPYAAKAIGMNLEQGELSMRAEATGTDGKLAADVNLDVNRLGFSALSAEDAARMSAAVGVPIETVVSLLEDADGRIKLDIPIAGQVNSPEFDFSDAVGKAVAGAVTATITAPFQLLFQPVAFLAEAAGGGQVAFKPILFPAGSTEVQADAGEYLDGIASMLKDRRKLALRVCGRATGVDVTAVPAPPPAASAPAPAPAAPGPAPEPVPTGQPQPAAPVPPQAETAEALAQRLEALAIERTRAVRRALVTDRGVDSGQVGECRSTFDANDPGPPRAEISF
jgi:hypothetical protein